MLDFPFSTVLRLVYGEACGLCSTEPPWVSPSRPPLTIDRSNPNFVCSVYLVRRSGIHWRQLRLLDDPRNMALLGPDQDARTLWHRCHQHAGLCILLHLLALLPTGTLVPSPSNQTLIYSQSLCRTTGRYRIPHLGRSESWRRWSHHSTAGHAFW